MSQINELSIHYANLIEGVGEDLERDGLHKTPARAAKALQELTCGYQQHLPDIVNDALYPSQSDEMIIVKNIELYSLCEHHLLPFIGKCHVAYIPDQQILGLSKVARVVDHFARRLQIQERLTREIAEAMQDITQAKGVGVIIEAQHLCMMMRGVEKQNSVMTTSVMLGALKESASARAEFLTLR